jgi:hypothetical protein
VFVPLAGLRLGVAVLVKVEALVAVKVGREVNVPVLVRVDVGCGV